MTLPKSQSLATPTGSRCSGADRSWSSNNCRSSCDESARTAREHRGAARRPRELARYLGSPSAQYYYQLCYLTCFRRFRIRARKVGCCSLPHPGSYSVGIPHRYRRLQGWVVSRGFGVRNSWRSVCEMLPSQSPTPCSYSHNSITQDPHHSKS